MNGDILTAAFRRIRDRFIGTDTRDDSMDCLQDAFCRIWSQRDRISDEKQAEGVLAVTARNIRIDSFRKKQKYPEVDIGDMGESSAGEESDNYLEIYEEVDRLIKENISERDRLILYRRERDGWEFEEIAVAFGLSESNVRMIVSRTRRTIREIYRKQNKGI